MSHVDSTRRTGRVRAHEPDIRWPTDDTLWSLQHMSWAEWAIALGVSDWTVRGEMHSRGWRRAAIDDQLNGLTHAPCRKCDAEYRVDGYPSRECPTCRLSVEAVKAKQQAGEALTLREERALSFHRRGIS